MKKKLFMLKKIWVDIKSPKRHYDLAQDMHNDQLGEYYFLFEEESVAKGKKQRLIQKFDENGIPINRTYVDVTDQEYVYFPISIGQMGLAVYHTYLNTKSLRDKERFLKFVDWFTDKNNYTLTKDLGAIWYTHVPLPQYKNQGPWQSAFVQSRAISILLRGYQLTGNEEFKLLAEQGLKSYEVLIDDGGVSSSTDFGPFYEEYTASTPTLVLNGMIFALCGVYDFIRIDKAHELANRIFQKGINTLEGILPEYDIGYWSKYNLCNAPWYPDIDPATIGYQRLHANQLEMLYQLTGKTIFNEFAQKFDAQVKLKNIVRMYIVKFKALRKIGRL